MESFRTPKLRLLQRTLTGFGTVVFAAWLGTVSAQQPKPLPKIGILWSGTPEATAPYVGALTQGLREFGWVDGQTAQIIIRYDNGDTSKLPKMARDLVALGVDVLAPTTLAVPAARQATTSIPIVATDAYDPIEQGWTDSLSHPKGNLTGVSWQSIETAARRLEMAMDSIPRLRRVVLLTDLGDPGAIVESNGLRRAAKRTNVELRVVDLRDVKAAFASIRSYRAQALIVPTTILTIDRMDKIVRFARDNRLPAIGEDGEFADAGFLYAYGANVPAIFKRAAYLIDRILRGAKPSELPYEQPTVFDLVVNLNTASALGIVVPESIQLRATRVIK
jgi:putative ABC transport system substrate-binding protein